MTAFRRIAQPTEDALVELLAGAQSDLHGLLTRLEPWERDFADKAWQGVADIAAALWPRLRQLMPGRSDLSLLQQAWAARFRSRVHIGLLYRAGLSHPDLLNETVRLHALTLRRWRSPTSASGDGAAPSRNFAKVDTTRSRAPPCAAYPRQACAAAGKPKKSAMFASQERTARSVFAASVFVRYPVGWVCRISANFASASSTPRARM